MLEVDTLVNKTRRMEYGCSLPKHVTLLTEVYFVRQLLVNLLLQLGLQLHFTEDTITHVSRKLVPH